MAYMGLDCCYLCKRPRESGQLRIDSRPLVGLVREDETAYRCGSDVRTCDRLYRESLTRTVVSETLPPKKDVGYTPTDSKQFKARGERPLSGPSVLEKRERGLERIGGASVPVTPISRPYTGPPIRHETVRYLKQETLERFSYVMFPADPTACVSKPLGFNSQRRVGAGDSGGSTGRSPLPENQMRSLDYLVDGIRREPLTREDHEKLSKTFEELKGFSISKRYFTKIVMQKPRTEDRFLNQQDVDDAWKAKTPPTLLGPVPREVIQKVLEEAKGGSVNYWELIGNQLDEKWTEEQCGGIVLAVAKMAEAYGVTLVLTRPEKK